MIARCSKLIARRPRGLLIIRYNFVTSLSIGMTVLLQCTSSFWLSLLDFSCSRFLLSHASLFEGITMLKKSTTEAKERCRIITAPSCIYYTEITNFYILPKFLAMDLS